MNSDPFVPLLRGAIDLSFLAAILVLSGVGELDAQASEPPGASAIIDHDADFRDGPDGGMIGTLRAGTEVVVDGEWEGWTRVTVEGVMRLLSMQVRVEDGFDLVVSSPAGEDLWDEPGGRSAGTFVRGALLEELGRVPGWGRVRRTAWIRTAALSPTDASDRASGIEASAPQGTGASLESERFGPEQGDLDLLAVPGGEVLGRVGAGSELTVLEQRGEWSKVRLEGWVRVPTDGWTAEVGPGGEETLSGMSPWDLSRDPERYRGRRIEMELQFLSLERAEAIRTDFSEGEPFLLTRTPDGGRTFVYVAVPADRLDEVAGLAPLERFRVVARVRTGAAAFTANPVLDLIRIERVR